MRTTPSGTTTPSPSGRTLAFGHGAADRETQRSLGDRFTLSIAWNDQGRFTGQTLTTPSTEHPQTHRTYAYRSHGHLTSVTDQHAGSRTFTLDQAGRVTTVQAADWNSRRPML
ncbi:hypothetical protein [Streptomyces sp. NPDC021562]|uniref:hypothetical protein n=1 Tax=Streptomyces sp. NPDC021562 TaxID=3155121 RepID=UPI0033E7A691